MLATKHSHGRDSSFPVTVHHPNRKTHRTAGPAARLLRKDMLRAGVPETEESKGSRSAISGMQASWEGSFMSSNVRVAVASSQGRQIDLLFGNDGQLLIFEVGDDTIRFIETRDVPFCEQIPESWAGEEGSETMDAIGDCQFMVSRGICPQARELLAEHGIRPLEMACTLAAGLVAIRSMLAS